MEEIKDRIQTRGGVKRDCVRPVGESQDDDAPEEGQASRGLRAPDRATEKERADHARTHLPYRDWCDICVRARGIAQPHGSGASPERYSEPQISCDYWYMGGQSQAEAEKIPVLVIWEKMRKALYAHVAPSKGPQAQTLKQVGKDLGDMGVKRAVYKTDQEPAITSFAEALQVEWGGELVPENSPIGDHDSNGAAESAVRVHQGMTRTYKLALERRLGQRVPDDSVTMQWLVEWAATMHRRYKVGTDGRTAFQRIRGKTADRAIAEFGERVLGQELRAGDDQRDNTEARYEEGAVMGIDERTDDIVIHTAEGLKRWLNLRRRPWDEQWSAPLALGVEMGPGEFYHSNLHRRQQRVINAAEPTTAASAQPAADEGPQGPVPRAFRTTAEDFQALGYSAGCPGCASLSRGANAGAARHTAQCRKRIEVALLTTEQGRQRLARANERFAQHAEDAWRQTERAQQQKGKPLPFSPGSRMIMRGLSSRPELNGTLVELVEYTSATSRWKFISRGGVTYNVLPANLARQPTEEEERRRPQEATSSTTATSQHHPPVATATASASAAASAAGGENENANASSTAASSRGREEEREEEEPQEKM